MTLNPWLTARIILPLLFVFACQTLLRAAPGDVAITEIMYKPRIEEYRELLDFAKIPFWWEEGDDLDAEYVELGNTGTETVNLGGWSFIEGIDYTFPANTMLGPGDHIAVCKNAATLRSHYSLSASQAVGDFTGELNNAGDRLTLIDDSVPPRILDTLRYNDNPPWPLAPDQAGLSLEVIDAMEDNGVPENWRTSRVTLVRDNAVRPADPEVGDRRPLLGGTPAAENTVHATDGIPPLVDLFSHLPLRPTSTDDVTITAQVTARDAITDVTLHYEFYREPYPYTSPVDSGSVTMVPGVVSKTYTATLPAQPSQTLARYRIEATDAAGRSWIHPDAFDLSPHRAYFHYDGEEETELPTYFLIMSQADFDRLELFNTTNDNKDSVEATVVVDGIVYDHIRTRYRACRRCEKRSHKFKFNKHELLRDMSRLDLDYDWPVLQKVASNLFWLLGRDNIATQLLRLNRNGEFFGVFMAQESPNRTWLARHGYDENSEIYKAKEGGAISGLPGTFRANLSYHPTPAGVYQKMYVKRGDSLGSFQSLIDLARDANQLPNSELENFFSTRFMLDEWHYPRTIHMTQPHCDYAIKNYYVFRAPDPDGRWNIVYFDYDRFWGCLQFQATGCHAVTTSLFCGGTEVEGKMITNTPTRNKIFDTLNDVALNILLPETVNAMMDYEFDRTVVDRQDERDFVSAGQISSGDANETIKQYFSDRHDFVRTFVGNLNLTEEDTGPQIQVAAPIGYESDTGVAVRIEWTHTERAGNPAVVDLFWTDFGFSYLQPIATGIPADQGGHGWVEGFPGFQNDIFIQARIRDGVHPFDGRNTNLTPVALFDTFAAPEFTPTLSPAPGPFVDEEQVTLTAQPGWDVYYTLDGTDPRVSDTRILYDGPFTVMTSVVVRAVAEDDTGDMISMLADGTYVTSEPNYGGLRISEIMYNPVEGQAHEFIELQNVGTTRVDLFGAEFTDGILFSFRPNTTVEPGGYLVLVSNPNVFEFIYPGVEFHGTYNGALSNAGEKVTLKQPRVTPSILGETIDTVDYDDGAFWPVAADGLGRSLVLARVDRDPDQGETWRASTHVGGSPGAADPDAVHGGVVIHEVLAHGDGPLEDAIELGNLTTAEIDVGGWYLSDNRDTEAELKKYRIPDATFIGPRGYVVLYENQFNASPGTDASLALDSNGGSVYLSAATPEGDLSGRILRQDYSAAPDGVTFGRYRTSQGLAFPSLSQRSLGIDSPGTVEEFRGGTGDANGAPRLGSVVINEIHYHPAAVMVGEDEVVEFLELKNTTGAALALYDDALGSAWTIDGISGVGGAAEYEFPADAEIPANSFALVVPIDPILYRARTGVAAEIPIYGPFGGALNNAGERIEIFRPIDTDGVNIARQLVDAVRFNDRDPWPLSPDGTGPSLERIRATKYGDDVINWGASLVAGGTPGAENGTVAADENLAPIVMFASAESEGFLSLDFDAGDCFDLDGTIVDYSWDFGDDLTGSGQLVTHQFLDEGLFNVTLTVTDDGGSTGQLIRAVEVTLVGVPFRRGDADATGMTDLSDPINNLSFLFLGTFTPPCMDAADTDDSGIVDLSDPLRNLTVQFLGGTIPDPGFASCGLDPTVDVVPGGDLGCEEYNTCN